MLKTIGILILTGAVIFTIFGIAINEGMKPGSRNTLVKQCEHIMCLGE